MKPSATIRGLSSPAAGLAMAVLCAAAPAQAVAQAPGAAATTVAPLELTPTVQASDWITMPTPDQLRALRTPQAARTALRGTAVLKCRILPTMAVSDCSVVSDTDPSHAVGDLALKASALFKLSSRAVNGTVVDDQWVTIPVTLDLKANGSAYRAQKIPSR